MNGATLSPACRRIAALLACHNRRELTLRALRSLAAAGEVFNLQPVLFDDGSTDGTAEAVRAEFPGTIILSGDGNAFWNGGMHAAWKSALELKPDAYLWLNDDVALDRDALVRLRDAWLEVEKRHDGDGAALVLAGATRNANGELTYGGMRKASSFFAFRLERLPESSEMQHADTINGNIVLVTAATVRRIGIVDPGFFHMYGDIDYGLRASEAGIPVLILKQTLGVCESNALPNLSEFSLAERWRYFLCSPRGIPPRNWWRMMYRHSGIRAPVHFLSAYRKLFYPSAWLQNDRRIT